MAKEQTTSSHKGVDAPQPKALSESSVLAPAFVPAAERQIHLLPILPGNLIESPSVPSLDSTLQLLNRTLVFPSPCFCAYVDPQRTTPCDWDDEPHVQKLVPDFRYALTPESSSSAAQSLFENTLSELRLEDQSDDIHLYSKRYERLLFFEYREMLRLYERYSQYHVQVYALSSYSEETSSFVNTVAENLSQSSTSFYLAKMYIRGIADARPALQPNDIILLRPQFLTSRATGLAPTIEIHSRVVSVVRSKDESARDIITFTWISPDQRVRLGLVDTYAVRFIPATTIWERSLTALTWALRDSQPLASTKNNILSEFLFPTQLPLLPSLSSLLPLDPLEDIRRGTDYSSLSLKQQQFVNLVLQRTLYVSSHHTNELRPPLLLTGPAGTGKTRTLLAAIRQVLHLHTTVPDNNPPGSLPKKTIHRVLVCTPSHTAADVITLRLSKFYDKTSLFRLYDADRPVSTVPLPILPFTSFSSETGGFTLPTAASQLLNFTIIVCTCSDAHVLYRMGLTNATLRQRKRCFQNFASLAMAHNQMSIVCNNNTTTLAIDSSKCLPVASTREDISSSIRGADELHFTHLFVDEAAQAMEPELLIPLSVVLDPTSQGKQAEVILVGDPRQLSPQVFSYTASHHPNGEKFFDLTCPMIERLLRRPSADGRKADLLGPLCDDNLNTLEDLLAYAFQSNKTVKLNGTMADALITLDETRTKTGSSDCSSSTCCIFLSMNYRGHACFLMMPSALFYDDRLQSKNEGLDLPNSCTGAGQHLHNASKNHDDPSEQIMHSNPTVSEQGAKPGNHWLKNIRLIESTSTIVSGSVMEEIYYFDADTKRYLHDNIINFKKQMSWPMHFRGVLGKDICDTVDSISGSNSWCNHEEAHAVVDIISKICFEGRASTEDIGVMAPYRSQVVLIRKLLRGKNLGGVNVGTVEDYQGVEKNIIVLSLTRSNVAFVNEDIKQRMGLFQQPMRMNVALTRAENMFVVVGNPHLMATDRLWKQWLCFCHRNGLWYGEGLDAKEMYHLYGKSRRHITCHVLRKLPPTGLYPNDKEVSESQIQDSLSKGPSNHLKYILMSSIERRVRLLELTSRMD